MPDSVPRIGERERENRPALVDPQIIEAIRESTERGDFDEVHLKAGKAPAKMQRLDLKRLIAAGQQPEVRINGHPLIGKLVGLDDSGRAQVLVELLGRSVMARTEAQPLELVSR